MITVLDISNWQSSVVWNELPHWVNGIYAKLGEGLTPDKTWHSHRVGAQSIHMELGPYYFAHPELHTPKESVQFAFKTLHSETALRPVLDYEWGGVKATEEWAREFSQLFKKDAGVFPFIYMSSNFLHKFSRPVGAGLWIANYDRNDGKDHPITTAKPWRYFVLHQYTSKGICNGIRGPVDLSHRPAGKTMEALRWKKGV